MSQSHQIAPFPNQVEPIDVPDDGALLIETTGVEVPAGWATPVTVRSASSNHNATTVPGSAANASKVGSFVAPLPRDG
jgi:hypothetical protein